MAFSQNIADVRQSQQDEMQKRSPAERLLMALELSDLCIQLHAAGKKTPHNETTESFTPETSDNL